MNAAAQIAEAFARLPAYLGGHVAVSVTALLLGLAISLPLAFASIRRPALRSALLGLASIVQTVPSLALLALFYPLLLGLAALTERSFGAGFSALGFLPSVLALTLYSMLPVLRNTIAGLEGIDPAIREAALGVGMTRRQSLTMVELPLALPIILAGIRTAAIWVIGAATLSTPIGQTSLGNYIFTGLQTQNWVFVLFGCAAAAIFALIVDQLLALMETGLARRKRGAPDRGALVDAEQRGRLHGGTDREQGGHQDQPAASHRNDAARSCRFADFAPMVDIPGVQLYSLQKGPAATQLFQSWKGGKVIDLQYGLLDYCDTASAIQMMDVVITVDTSVAHLAGALGKTVWTLIPTNPDWRWLLGRDDSPWYPTMRLFRQPVRDEWGGVFAAMAAALKARIAGG